MQSFDWLVFGISFGVVVSLFNVNVIRGLDLLIQDSTIIVLLYDTA